MAINLLLLPADAGNLNSMDDLTQDHDVGGIYEAHFITGKFSANGSAYAHLRNVLQQVFVKKACLISMTPIVNDQEVATATQEIVADPAIVGTSYQFEIPFFQGGVDFQLRIANDSAGLNEFGSCEMWLVPRRQRNV